MSKRLLTELLKMKLDLADRFIGMLPEGPREKAENLCRTALTSVQEAAETYLHEHPGKRDDRAGCTKIDVE